MAKHLYSPRISDIWKEVESALDAEEALTPHLRAVIEGVVSRLEERDNELEDALLGDLTVNNVNGTVGTVPTAAARQIGWSVNFGYFTGNATDSGRGDGSQDFTVTYGQQFLTDTSVLLITPVFVPGQPGYIVILRSSNKSGFVATTYASPPTTPTPVAVSYMAIGF